MLNLTAGMQPAPPPPTPPPPPPPPPTPTTTHTHRHHTHTRKAILVQIKFIISVLKTVLFISKMDKEE